MPALQGEMGATAFLHPYEWVAAGQLLKARVLAAVPRGWQRNIRIGISMNNVRLPRLQVAVLRNGMRTAVRAVHAVHNEPFQVHACVLHTAPAAASPLFAPQNKLCGCINIGITDAREYLGNFSAAFDRVKSGAWCADRQMGTSMIPCVNCMLACLEATPRWEAWQQ